MLYINPLKIQTTFIKRLSIPMIYKIAGFKTEEHVSGDIVLKINGMSCSNCEDAVKAAALKCIGVKDVKVNHKEGKAIINANFFKIDVNELRDVVEGTGFPVSTILFNTEI